MHTSNFLYLMKGLTLSILLIFLAAVPLFAQSSYPQNYFRSPVDVPLYLSGTFGEPRADHFHAGIDIKTKQIEGLPIYAVADGYVSRIKISPYGYGNALYITHPNGYVSVYAHLQRLSTELHHYVKDQQYAQKKFAIELFPKKDQFTFEKGNIIAYSGNSGGSGGPHLHFEIRDSRTSQPINPILFGLDVRDAIKPIITQIGFYPLGNMRFVSKPIFEKVHLKDGIYSPSKDTIRVNSHQLGLGINTFDQHTGSQNKNGTYIIDLKIDGLQIFQHKMETFSFAETKYIRSHLDYEQRLKHKRYIQKCFVEPNNKLSTYKSIRQNGIITFNKNGDTKHVSITVSDIHGNKSQLSFYTQYAPLDTFFKPEVYHFSHILFPHQANVFETEDVYLRLPKEALFDTVFFAYTQKNSPNGYSDKHHLHTYTSPLFTYGDLKIKPSNLNEKLYSKALIIHHSPRGKISKGGTYTDGYVSTKVRTLGLFYVDVDTTAPRIKPIDKQTSFSTLRPFIRFKIKDNLSGIKSYNCYIDGIWTLAIYDAKNHLLTCPLEDISQGKHQMRIEVMDYKDNKASMEMSFIKK